jgi:dTMP kinase
MALLFAADRLHHVQAVIAPALARGRVVVSDRYVMSSLAYQGTLLGERWVAAINARAPRPDLTVFVDVPVAVAARRRAARGGGVDIYEVDETQRRVARAYREACRRRDVGPVVVVRGVGTEEEVEGRIWRAVTRARGGTA